MITDIKRSTIQDFLLGILPGDQMLSVANVIENDPKLIAIYKEEKERLKVQAYVDCELQSFFNTNIDEEIVENKTMQKDAMLHKEIDEAIECLILKETLTEISSSKSRSKLFGLHIPKYSKWIAAASIVVLLSVGLCLKFVNTGSLEDRLYAKYYKPFHKIDNYIVHTSSLTYAQQKYLEGDYKNAYLLFNKLPNQLPIESEKYFFTALSLMELGHFDQAIENFEDILNGLTYFEGTPQVYWYLSLCYLKSGKTEKAKEVLRKIEKNRSYNYKEAKEILNKLESKS